MFLDQPEGVAKILEKLLRSENKDDAMMAFQTAFDLIENEHQAFLLSVRDQLSSPKLKPEQPKSHRDRYCSKWKRIRVRGHPND